MPTECEPVGGGVEGLGESDADQLVHEAGERGPGGVLVVAQAEQVDVPAVPQYNIYSNFRVFDLLYK